jgi:hypothetical protein
VNHEVRIGAALANPPRKQTNKPTDQQPRNAKYFILLTWETNLK